MAGLLPTLHAKAGLELLLLAARDRGLDHFRPRVGRANLAPGGVGLEHKLVPRDRTQHLLKEKKKGQRRNLNTSSDQRRLLDQSIFYHEDNSVFGYTNVIRTVR